jgi:ABC-2 type transport system ATP-binding protein/bacitracin transport system ATP-binding protein
MSVIRVQGLSKSFGGLKAVDDLNFEVQKGQVFGFLGQNGSGKSTTIRMLLSLIHPSSGSIEIFGKPVNKNRAELFEKIGAIIERPDLYPYLNAREHLNLFLKARKNKISKSAIDSTLEKVGLLNRQYDKVQTFSLGMKQRLGIAIALVHNPDLIILDEPTNGLDPNGIADMRQLIRQLANKEGKTVFVSSHLLSEIEQISSQVLIIHKGQRIAYGNTKELLDPDTAILQIKTLDDEGALNVINRTNFKEYLLDNKTGIYIKMPISQISILNEMLVFNKVSVIGIETKNTLEDYFLQVTSN